MSRHHTVISLFMSRCCRHECNFVFPDTNEPSFVMITLYFHSSCHGVVGMNVTLFFQTPMNKASSRSHCIFTLHVTARETGSATIRRAKLHLVDLAGWVSSYTKASLALGVTGNSHHCHSRRSNIYFLQSLTLFITWTAVFCLRLRLVCCFVCLAASALSSGCMQHVFAFMCNWVGELLWSYMWVLMDLYVIQHLLKHVLLLADPSECPRQTWMVCCWQRRATSTHHCTTWNW